MKVLLVAAASLTLSFGAAVGVNLQKLSMTREEERRGGGGGGGGAGKDHRDRSHGNRKKPRPPYLQPMWCAGMVVIVLDACGDFVFVGLAPQSLLAPLGSLSLGWNLILAPLFRHPSNEKVTRQVVAATALIYVGTITTVLFAAGSTPTYDLDKISALLSNRQFLVYLAATIAFQIGLVGHGRRRRQRRRHSRLGSGKKGGGVVGGRSPSNAGGRSPSNFDGGGSSSAASDAGAAEADAGYGVVHYCGLAGCFGGQCILFAKCLSELAKNAILSKNWDDWTSPVSRPLPYLFLLGMVGSVLTQLHFLNTGLSKYDVLVVCPVYQSFWNAFGITGGLIFFREYEAMTPTDGVMYGLGILVTLVGVAVLVRQRSRRAPGGEREASNGATSVSEAASPAASQGQPPTTTTTTTPDSASSQPPQNRRRTSSATLKIEDEQGETMRHRPVRARILTEELKAVM